MNSAVGQSFLLLYGGESAHETAARERSVWVSFMGELKGAMMAL